MELAHCCNGTRTQINVVFFSISCAQYCGLCSNMCPSAVLLVVIARFGSASHHDFGFSHGCLLLGYNVCGKQDTIYLEAVPICHWYTRSKTWNQPTTNLNELQHRLMLGFPPFRVEDFRCC